MRSTLEMTLLRAVGRLRATKMRLQLSHRTRETVRVLGGCLALAVVLLAPRAQAAFRPGVLAELDAAITNAIAEKRCPGAVLWLERQGQVYHKAYGRRTYAPGSEPITLDTVFDVASLTKVLATTPAVMLLLERGRVRLDAPLRLYIEEFQGPGTEAVTLRHLLTHTSGLVSGISSAPFQDYQGAIARAVQEKPYLRPGSEFHYCDVNFILLGELVRRVAHRPLQEYVAAELYRPLRLNDTGYLPGASQQARLAPTQPGQSGMTRVPVHDPTADRMGGVAGHAGVFSTAPDIARFARMLLNEGQLGGVRLFKPSTIRLMTSVQSPKNVPARRGLGWDIDSPYSRPRGLVFPLGSYGHTGWTGALLWIDPFSKTFVIFLSNRVLPDSQGNVLELYACIGTLAAQAVDGFDFNHVPGALSYRTNFINWGAATNFLVSPAGSAASGSRSPKTQPR